MYIHTYVYIIHAYVCVAPSIICLQIRMCVCDTCEAIKEETSSFAVRGANEVAIAEEGREAFIERDGVEGESFRYVNGS